jgi:hypothetical protein
MQHSTSPTVYIFATLAVVVVVMISMMRPALAEAQAAIACSIQGISDKPTDDLTEPQKPPFEIELAQLRPSMFSCQSQCYNAYNACRLFRCAFNPQCVIDNCNCSVDHCVQGCGGPPANCRL